MSWIFRLLAAAVGLGLAWFFAGSAGSVAIDEPTSTRPVRAAADTSFDGDSKPSANQQQLTPTTSTGSLWERLGKASPEDFPAIWEEFTSTPGVHSGDFSWPGLFNREWVMREWVKVDPEGAVTYLSEATGSGASNLHRLLDYWLMEDSNAALAAIDSLDWGSVGLSEAAIHSALASHFPLLSLERFEANGSDPALLGALLSKWAKKDPEAALAYAKKFRGGAASATDWNGIARGWPQERMAELFPLLDLDNIGAIRTFGGRIARADSKLGLDWILSQPSGEIQTGVLNAFLGKIQGDPDIITKLAAIPVEQAANLDKLKNLLSGNFPDRAAVWEATQALPPEIQRGLYQADGQSLLSYNWALEDTDAAVAALRDLPAGADGRGAFAEGIARALGQRDPDAGLAMASQMPADEQPAFIDSLAGSWAALDFDGFADYLETAPDTEATRDLYRGGFGSIADESPQDAAALLDLFEGDEQTDRAGELAYSWARRDAPAAAEFIATIDNEAVHDAATIQLGQSVVDRNPQAALQAYASIKNPEARSQQLSEFIGHFAADNLQAARVFIRDTPMDDATRTILVSAIAEP